jgi:hypothetical protein
VKRRDVLFAAYVVSALLTAMVLFLVVMFLVVDARV